MINLYKARALKDYIDQEDDPQREITGIAVDSRILLCGGSGSGKTNALGNYIVLTASTKKGTFHHIYIVRKTDEPIYDWLRDQCGEHITFFRDVRELPDVNEFVDLTKSRDKHRYLVVFDDCVTDTNKTVKSKIDAYYSFSRKKGVTCCYLTQSYFATPTFIRRNTQWVALCGISSAKDLQTICREYTVGADVDQMQRMYHHATSEPLRPLLIATGAAPPGRKFSAGFNNWLNPADFA